MKRKKILLFLKEHPISNFEKLSEPQSIAYEQFVKSKHFVEVSPSYFNSVYNELRIIIYSEGT